MEGISFKKAVNMLSYGYNIGATMKETGPAPMLQTIKQLYTDSPFPVAAYDGELGLVWANEAARANEAQMADLRDLRRRVQAEQLLRDLAQNGIAHCRRTPALSERGITLLQQGDYIVALWDKEKAPKTGKAVFYGLGGIDSLNAAVRSDVDGIVLAATALERMVDSDDPETETLFQRVRRDSYRILRNVNNVTLLARYYDGTLQLNKQNADIGALVAAMCDAALDVCGRRVPVSVNVTHPVETAVDVPLFERAFINVLLNALRYTADGNAIDVTVSATDAAVMVAVRDRGTGIQPELAPDVQTPYFSAEPAADSAARPGLGLGLAVANIFCAVHGGTLLLESEYGRGTTAVLSFARHTAEGGTVKAGARRYVTDRFSPIYVELCDLCDIPN